MKCALCGFGKADKRIPQSMTRSDSGEWVPGPRVLPPSLLARAYELAEGEERSEFVHNRKGCWAFKWISEEKTEILRKGAPVQTRHSSISAYMPAPKQIQSSKQPEALKLADFAISSAEHEWQELGLLFVPSPSDAGSTSTDPPPLAQPPQPSPGAMPPPQPQQPRAPAAEEDPLLTRTAGGKAPQLGTQLPAEAAELAEPACLSRIPGHMRGGLVTAGNARAVREQTGAKARAPPQTWEQRTDPSSRCNPRFLSELERAHRELRKAGAAAGAAADAQAAEWAERVATLEGELEVYKLAGEMLLAHGLPDTPFEMSQCIVNGHMRPDGIMSYRVADHVDNCQRSKCA